jgi:hypothetical protein
LEIKKENEKNLIENNETLISQGKTTVFCSKKALRVNGDSWQKVAKFKFTSNGYPVKIVINGNFIADLEWGGLRFKFTGENKKSKIFGDDHYYGVDWMTNATWSKNTIIRFYEDFEEGEYRIELQARAQNSSSFFQMGYDGNYSYAPFIIYFEELPNVEFIIKFLYQFSLTSKLIINKYKFD